MDRQYRILKALGSSDDGLTVSEIVSATGLTSSAIRSEMPALTAIGVVRNGLARSGGVGRPAIRYQLTDEPSSAYAALVGILLGYATSTLTSIHDLLTAAHNAGVRNGGGEYPDGVATRAANTGFNPVNVTTDDDLQQGITRFRMTACPVFAAVMARGGETLCTIHEASLSGTCASVGGQMIEFVPAHPQTGQCEFAMVRAAEAQDFRAAAHRLADAVRQSEEPRGAGPWTAPVVVFRRASGDLAPAGLGAPAAATVHATAAVQAANDRLLGHRRGPATRVHAHPNTGWLSRT